MSTYSFLDVNASITGPNGNIQLGQGASVAEEGISFELDERNTLTKGSDGAGMHNLHAWKGGKVRVRLLKTSPTNGALSLMGSTQLASSALHGKNVILLNNAQQGDVVAARGVAFTKLANLTFATEGGMNEWEFDAIAIDPVLGFGVPDVNT